MKLPFQKIGWAGPSQVPASTTFLHNTNSGSVSLVDFCPGPTSVCVRSGVGSQSSIEGYEGTGVRGGAYSWKSRCTQRG